MADTVLYSGVSSYNTIHVLESDGKRILAFGEKGTEQETGYNPLCPDELVFEYPRLMLPALALKPGSKRILMLGLGGGYLPGLLQRNRPDIQITVVEVDPLVVFLAEKYFDCTNEGSLSIVVGDGRHFLDASQEVYDQIWVDVFDLRYIPPAFTTVEFLTLCQKRLVKGGVLVQNVHNDHPLFWAHQATYTKVFGYFYLIEGQEDANAVIMAQKESQRPSTPAQAFAKGLKGKNGKVGAIHLKPTVQTARLLLSSDPKAVLYDHDDEEE